MEESIKKAQGFAECCREKMRLKKMDPDAYSPLALAYMGDAVYEIIIRTLVMNRGNMQVNKLHKKTAGLVKAGTQAAMARLLEGELTGDELAVFKRGRNAKSMTTAKNASVIDYRMATGLEALTGYLYLAGQYDRLLGLIGSGLEKIGELKTE